MSTNDEFPPHLERIAIDTFEICRKKQGKGFSYYYLKNRETINGELLEQLKGIGVPATWSEVKLCANPNAYILATGYDGSQKLQYLYHPDYLEYRNLYKFNELHRFGDALPKIRRRIRKDLKQKEWDRHKLMALMVRILDKYHLRIGSRAYAKKNRSFGLTTLRKKHLKEVESNIRFEYLGKGSVKRSIELNDPSLLGLIREIAEHPGWELFSIKKGSETIRATSTDINKYIREVSKSDFTARTFRTWAGTVWAVKNARKARKIVEKNPRREMAAVLAEMVAEKLGNTPAICRSYYIHPGVFERAIQPNFSAAPRKLKYLRKLGYRKAERRTLELLAEIDKLEYNGK